MRSRSPSTRRPSSPSSPTCGSPASRSARCRTSSSRPTANRRWPRSTSNDKYAPIPRGTRAILRTKTLLGETYIELTPGDRNGPELPDGGTLPEANIAESVQLDEIFRTFNAQTRAAFQSWQQEAAVGDRRPRCQTSPTPSVSSNRPSPSSTASSASSTASGSPSTSSSATAPPRCEALRGRQGELAGLIRNSNTVFTTAAARDRDIEALFRAFPTFQDESRLTLKRLKTFALDADPVIKQLVPVAEQLSPTFIALSKLAPQAKGFFEGLEPVIARAPTGFPALRKLFRDQFPPLLRAVDPFLRNLNPVITGLGLYKHELTAAMANVASMSNASLTTENAAGEHTHYLRAMGPFSPESLATYPSRTTTNRTNAYPQPLATKALASGLPSFDTRGCTSGVTATLDPESAKSEVFKARTKKGSEKEAETLFNLLKKYAFAEQTDSAAVPAPGCTQQAPFSPIGKAGAATTYQHVYEQE